MIPDEFSSALEPSTILFRAKPGAMMLGWETRSILGLAAETPTCGKCFAYRLVAQTTSPAQLPAIAIEVTDSFRFIVSVILIWFRRSLHCDRHRQQKLTHVSD